MPTQPPVDPNVKLPGRVAAQAAQSASLHAAAYQTPASPQPDPSPAPAPAIVPAPEPQPLPPAAPQPEPQPQPIAPAPAAPQSQPGVDRAPAAGELTQEQWRHRFLSMQGRYQQAAQSMGGMQEQMSEMGDELMRMQDALQQTRAAVRPSVPQVPGAPAPEQFLTAEEVQQYGPELIDVIQRAARAAVMPDLRNVHTGVQQVSQRVQQVSVTGLYQTLDEQVPNWREINVSPRFKQWCSLPDVYSGQVRGMLLKAAFQAASAPRVVAFFKGFLMEEQATGQLPDPLEPQPAPLPPRAPATNLDTLIAPGRAKPAGGDTNPAAPADKPIFTRQQIAAFYAAVRQGQYAGRDQDKNATEQAIFAAQREGRVRF